MGLIDLPSPVDRVTKPEPWDVRPSRIREEWRWAWGESLFFACPFWFLAGENLLTGQTPTKNADGSLARGPFGEGVALDGSGTWTWDHPSHGHTDATFFVLFRPDTNDNFFSALRTDTGNSGYNLQRRSNEFASTLEPELKRGSNENLRPGFQVEQGIWWTLSVRYIASTETAHYVAQHFLDPSTRLTATDTDNSGTDFSSSGGVTTGTTDTPAPHSMGEALLWLKDIGASRVEDLHRAPFGWIRPQQQIIVRVPSAGVSLTPDALAQAQEVDASGLTQAHSLSPNPITQGQTLAASTLAQVHQLAAEAIAQGSALDSPALSQVHSLLTAAVTQGQSLDSSALDQLHQLTAAEIDQPQTVGGSTLTQDHTLTTDALAQAQALEQVTLGTGVLTPEAVTHAQAVESATLSQLHDLALNALSQLQALAAAGLTQLHDLTAEEVTQPQTVESPALDITHVLTADGLTQQQDVAESSLSVVHVLSPEEVVHDQSVAIVQLTQHHTLTAEGLEQAQALEEAGFTGAAIALMGPFTMTGEALSRTMDGEDARRTMDAEDADRTMSGEE